MYTRTQVCCVFGSSTWELLWTRWPGLLHGALLWEVSSQMSEVWGIYHRTNYGKESTEKVTGRKSGSREREREREIEGGRKGERERGGWKGEESIHLWLIPSFCSLQTVGMNRMFHPECFVCSSCGALIGEKDPYTLWSCGRLLWWVRWYVGQVSPCQSIINRHEHTSMLIPIVTQRILHDYISKIIYWQNIGFLPWLVSCTLLAITNDDCWYLMPVITCIIHFECTTRQTFT